MDYTKFFSVYLEQDIEDPNVLGEEREVTLTCPFHDCQKENHFFANTGTGLWSCKRCDEEGNALSLITKIHSQYLKLTTKEDYKELSSRRGIPASTFKAAEWAYDEASERWYVPYFNFDPKTGEYSKFLTNLGYFYWNSTNERSRYVIRKSPALPLYLYNPGILQCQPTESEKLENVYIAEGEWDTLALYAIFGTRCDRYILGKPGAGFPKTFLYSMSETSTCTFLLDNDEAGIKQTEKAVAKLPKLMTVRQLEWKLVDNAPNDIRDLIQEHGRMKSKKIIEKALVDIRVASEKEQAEDKKVLTAGYLEDAESVPPIHSFNEYLEGISKLIYTNPTTRKAMAAVFGITQCDPMEGNPLWTFLKGPASCGKTTFLESFGGSNQYFDSLSKITAKSLISGWRAKDDEEDNSSYIKRLIGKNAIIKDFTVTLMGSKEEQQEVFGLLTDIYDGCVKIPYGNNKVEEFHNCYFNLIGGVTEKVQAHSSATIGERFLRIDYLGDISPEERRQYSRQSLLNFGRTIATKETMTQLSLGFFNHLRSIESVATLPEEYIDPIVDLAEFAAFVRTKVEKHREEGAIYRPKAELSPRLSNQFGRLFVGVIKVFQKDFDAPSSKDFQEAYDIVLKVAMDTCSGFPLDILRCIAQNPSVTRKEIAKMTSLNEIRIHRTLQDMVQTDVLAVTSSSSSKPGRPSSRYAINPSLIRALQLDPCISIHPKFARVRGHSLDNPNPPKRKRATSSPDRLRRRKKKGKRSNRP